MVENGRVEYKKEEVLGVFINIESDEVNLRYIKKGKETQTTIGYAPNSMEAEINNKINMYKNQE